MMQTSKIKEMKFFTFSWVNIQIFNFKFFFEIVISLTNKSFLKNEK